MSFANRWWVIGMAIIVAALGANAQLPVINSFSRTGLLTCSNLAPMTAASIEWASSVLGPWHTNTSALDSLIVDATGRIQVNVPLSATTIFYRVRGFASTNSSSLNPPPAPPGMVWIPPGTFVMGSPDDEKERNSDETQHTVTLTNGFYMSKNLVTQGQYLALMGNNPSYFTTNIDGNGTIVSPDLNRPVEQVTWYDAANYCGKLTDSEQAAGRLPAGWVYRLPTESEWEYACRAGTTTAFNLGPDLRSGMANFVGQYEYVSGTGTVTNKSGIYLGRTATVGSYQPNAWGLYDMHGNMVEWCSDWYDSYPVGSVTDPQGPTSGQYRVLRGGYWFSYAKDCRSALRDFEDPRVAYNGNFGFRSVLAPSH